MNKTRISAIPLTMIVSANIPVAYVPNTPQLILPNACVFIRIVNDSSEAVIVSYDGINDNEYVAANSNFNFPIQSVAIPVDNLAMMAKGTNIYMRGTAGNGTISISGYYL